MNEDRGMVRGHITFHKSLAMLLTRKSANQNKWAFLKEKLCILLAQGDGKLLEVKFEGHKWYWSAQGCSNTSKVCLSSQSTLILLIK